MSHRAVYVLGAAIVLALLLNAQSQRYAYMQTNNAIIRLDNWTGGLCVPVGSAEDDLRC